MITEKKLKKVLDLLDSGMKVQDISAETGVSKSSIYQIQKGIKDANEENQEEEQYNRDDEDTHDVPPFNEENPETPKNLEASPEDPSDESEDNEVFPSDELENEDPEDLLEEGNDAFPDMQQETEGSDFIPAIASLVKVLETGNTNLIRAIDKTEKIESVVKSSVAVATAEFQKTIELASQNLNFATKTIEENAERFKVSAENSVKPSGSSIPAQNESLFRIHLLFALLVYLLVFFMAIPLTRDVIYIINGVMFFCSSLLTGLALIRKNIMLAFSATASFPLPFVLFAGYYCTLLDPSIGKPWLYGLLAVPAALIVTAIIYLKTKAKGDK